MSSDANSEDIRRAVQRVERSLEVIEEHIRPTPGTDKYEILVAELARMRAQCEILQQVAWRMGSS